MKLYPHQAEALKQVEGRRDVAFYHDMGLGKTFTGAEQMMKCGNRVNIIICQKSKIADWVNHFVEHYANKARIYDLTKKKSFDLFWDELGMKHLFPVQRVAVINYELAWRRKSLLKLSYITLMLDESSLIQNKTAKQTKFVMKLHEHAENVILLSGTPTAGKYENLWTQARLLGWDISEDLYNRQYINWKTIQIGRMFHKAVDMSNPYKNVDRLKAKLREHGAHFLKTEDVLDLPEQNFVEINVQRSKEYAKFMKTSIVEIEDRELVGDTTLTKRIYARQLCGTYSENKLDAFRDLLQSTNDRLIVFYNFTEEAKRMIRVVNELGRPWGIINGEQKLLAPYENYDDSVTFVQYQAGAMGLNLQMANKIVYYSLPERSELFEQSKKRIHRIGQKQPCFYYILMCDRTIERSIYETLKLRKDYTDELFREEDGKYVGGEAV